MSAPTATAPAIEPNAAFQHPTGMYASDLEHLSTLQCPWVALRGPCELIFYFARFPDFRRFPATHTAPMSAPTTQAPTIEPNAVFQHPTGMYASDLEHLSTLQCLWVAWCGPCGRFCLCSISRSFSSILSPAHRANQGSTVMNTDNRAQRRVPTSFGVACK